jgi:zinc/manganese transport system permease protein
MIELLLWPFVAGFVLAGIHAYFGMHVLARGVVFADLALAQVAALGLTLAILAGYPVNSQAGYWYGLAFAIGGAVLFALTRPYEKLLQQEAVIGIVYAVSASVGVLVLDRAPQGAEHMKQLLIGSILSVTPPEVGEIALLYGAIGVLHVLFRRPLTEVSFRPLAAEAAGRNLFLWDVLFYVSFALVVTSSVRVAGVLLVFSYLIVPAALSRLLTVDLHWRLLLAWVLGVALTALGLYASWTWDLPTGPAIVAAFGGACALVALGFGAWRLTRRKAAMIVCVVATVTGFLLAAFPALDQPWLDALEDMAPPVQTVFLNQSERATREEVLGSIVRGRAELTRLRRLEQDVRWGAVAIEPERAERLRQYLAGRSEIGAGDQLVLRSLRGKARERQRFALGLPLLLIGVGGFFALVRRRAEE